MTKFVSIIVASLLMSSWAQAGGFEKSTLWSGKYMAIGGAAASSVEGPESLYFNPAGLSRKGSENTVSVNLSPTTINYKAPNFYHHHQETAATGFSPVNSFLYSRKISEKLGLGIGTYSAGGTNVEYKELDVSGRTLKPNVRSVLSITEFSIGAGYEIDPAWRVGLAWRGVFLKADMAGAVNTPGATLINPEYRNMTGSNMLGYRLGVQYEPNEIWGLGLMYRNAVGLTANGRVGGYAELAGTQYGSADGDLSVKAGFPQQLSIGGHCKAMKPWEFFAEYTWSQYGQIDRLDFEGSYGILGTTVSVSDQMLNWSDQNAYRLGAEYQGWSWPLRMGFVWTSKVTPEDKATTTLAPPGVAHTYQIGTGQKFLTDKSLSVDGGFEYTTNTGTVGDDVTGPKHGTYSGTVWALHLGTTYRF